LIPDSDWRTDHGAPAHRLDDAIVIARSVAEPELFTVLVRRHAPVLLRYVTRRIGADAAEDVLAETFLAAFNQRGRYDVTRPDARPWLYGIATNLLRRHQRTEVQQLRVCERTGIDPVVAAFTDRADERVSADAVKRKLAGALRRLRPAYRDVLLLLTWGELTYEEAADALGVPLGTIRSRMSRARQQLRADLGGVNPLSIREEHDERS
jgi:RNA polymerase sigma factor (sigma-70 family)